MIYIFLVYLKKNEYLFLISSLTKKILVMNFYEKIKLIFKQPGVLIRYRSFQVRKVYFYLSKYIHLKTFTRKRKIDYKVIYTCMVLKRLT